MPLVKTRAILFRAHPYSETSKVLRFYTEELGLVGVMARGNRRQASKGRGAPDTFGEGVAVISYNPSRDLHSLREFAPTCVRFGLGQDLRRLAGASVLAELVLRHAGQEPHEALFRQLTIALDSLSEGADERLVSELLTHAWGVVQLLGFGPVLDCCTHCGREVGADEMGRFDHESGGLRCSGCPHGEHAPRLGPVARGQLQELMSGVPVAVVRKATAQVSLLDDFVTFHMLGGRRLESFRFLHGWGVGEGTEHEEGPGDRGDAHAET